MWQLLTQNPVPPDFANKLNQSAYLAVKTFNGTKKFIIQLKDASGNIVYNVEEIKTNLPPEEQENYSFESSNISTLADKLAAWYNFRFGPPLANVAVASDSAQIHLNAKNNRPIMQPSIVESVVGIFIQKPEFFQYYRIR